MDHNGDDNKARGEKTFAVTGITGKVGSRVARVLLAQGHTVRAVVRSRAKGDEWADLGCKIFVASVDDATAMTEAFRGVDGVFLMTPPNYDPEPGFPDTQKNSAAISTERLSFYRPWEPRSPNSICSTTPG